MFIAFVSLLDYLISTVIKELTEE